MKWILVTGYLFYESSTDKLKNKRITAVVAQWIPQAEGMVFESQPRQTLVVKTGSDNSTAKRLAIGEFYRSSEMPIINGCPLSE